MAASRYLEKKLLEHSLKKAEYAMASKIYIALCTSAPTKSSTGSTIVEPSYTGYERIEIKAADLKAASEGDPSTIVNEKALTLKSSSSGKATVGYFAIVDASSTGNVLYWGALKESFEISPTVTTLEIKVGELEITAE